MLNRVSELRKTNGLTQQELADKLEVSRQTIISLEKGKYDPSIGLAHKIAKLFKRKLCHRIDGGRHRQRNQRFVDVQLGNVVAKAVDF